MREPIGDQFRRVLAVDPTTRGFGYALFEGPRRLVDWGMKDIQGDKQEGALRKTEELIRRYEPIAFVTEDCGDAQSRRTWRVRRLTEEMVSLARHVGIMGCAMPLVAVYQHFAKKGAHTKYDIALTLARQFPALMLRLPPKRKPWQSEDSRMSIFDAAAFGFTYLARRQKAPTPAAPRAAPPPAP